MNKILIIAPDYYPAKGGVENFLFNLNKYLDKKYDIEIFSGTRVSPKISKKYIINSEIWDFARSRLSIRVFLEISKSHPIKSIL